MKQYLSSILVLSTIKTDLFAAEAGMPQLDPTYWASQAFWLILVFSLLYISISKFFLPKIKSGLEDREKKINDDLNEAKNLKDLAELKQNEYTNIIENAKKDSLKIITDSKNELNSNIAEKKIAIEKEIEKEIQKAHSEILQLKASSINDINFISEELSSKIIEDISGDKLNNSSIEAAVSEVSKNNIEKYL